MAVTSTLTQDWDSFAVATMARRAPTLAKQTIDENPLLDEVAVKSINTAGGLRIEVPLEIGRNPNVKYLQSAEGTMSLAPTEVAGMAVYKPSLLVCPIKFNDIEKKLNSGKEQFIDLVTLRMNQTKRSMSEVLNQALYGRGENLKTIGLGAYVPTTVGSNTVGTISEATNPFWKPQVRLGCGSFAQNGHGGTVTDYLLNMWITCTASRKSPDFLVADTSFYEYYEGSELQRVRITSNNPGPGGIYDSSMRYRGVPILFDKMCDAGTVFMLHRDAFSWYVAPGMNMDVSKMKDVPDQPFVSYVVVTLFHQWVCERRNLLARLAGWTR